MSPRIVIVLPAYNAARTLAATLSEVPSALDVHYLLVDDASTDRTAELARHLGLEVHQHPINRGYGGNQKTCYTEALKGGADIVVMLHPDRQYHPRAIPAMVDAIVQGGADVVLASRFTGPITDRGGMPGWRAWGNRLLTHLQNRSLGLTLTEYHSGLRAYSAEALRTLPFEQFSDDFLFDQQLIFSARRQGLCITEVRGQGRYFDGASSISLARSLSYGVGTLGLCWARTFRPH